MGWCQEVDNAELIAEFQKFEKGKHVNIFTTSDKFEANFDMGVKTDNVFVSGVQLVIKLAFRDYDIDQYFSATTVVCLLNGKCYKTIDEQFQSVCYTLVDENEQETKFEFHYGMML